MKNIIREVAPEWAELRDFFDDDGLTEKGGEYCYNLFIVSRDRWGGMSGFNLDEYERVSKQAEEVLDGFSDADNGVTHWDGARITYKDTMQDAGIAYNPRKCHALREWAKTADYDKPESIAAFLTVTTGKRWGVTGVHGYSQGDYVDVVYCVDHYDDPRVYGEIWLGCAKEFCVIDLDENGEEADSVGGYIVADCQAWDDQEYKRLVCQWADIRPEETRLEMIDGSTVHTVYSYRAC